MNVSAGANDQTSSWENKSSYNGRWHTNANSSGTCRTMNAKKELSYVGSTDNDKLTSGLPTAAVEPVSREPAIEVESTFRSFRSGVETIRAVDGVDLRVSGGEMACIYGASGSGKTTLLNLVAGLDVADRGIVRVADRNLTSASERERATIRLHSIGVIFQENNLIHEFTAMDNIVVPLLARGRSYEEASREATTELARVGIEHLAGRFPREMSGGERQRVGIARALAGGRSVLVADEPTGALDSANSKALFSLIASLCHDHGVAALVATHDPLAQADADTVWSMRDGQLGPEQK